MEANRIEEKIYKYGADILASEGMQKEKTFVQHGSITCYDHSLRVAEKSLELAEKGYRAQKIKDILEKNREHKSNPSLQ